MPPHKLGIAGTQTYASQVQSAQEYVSGCQMPLVVEFEQAVYIHIIVARDFFAKFNMDYLLRADLKTRMEAYEIGIRARVIRPSEARAKEDLSPDPALDKLSENDYRPGTSGTQQGGQSRNDDRPVASRVSLKALLAVHDNAVRCIRRERHMVTQLAKKHASDVEAWQSGLKTFYEEHAGFVAQTMRMSIDTARAYAAQHGDLFERKGVAMIDGDAGQAWERSEADELAALSLEGERIAA